MLSVTMETVSGGRRLRVARLGKGPPLVLLHGYPENLQIWCELTPLLAERFEVIAFDWPGMGESDPWPGAVAPEHMAARVVALLDHWGIERASLVGHDMGGQPALACAARHPDRVERGLQHQRASSCRRSAARTPEMAQKLTHWPGCVALPAT